MCLSNLNESLKKIFFYIVLTVVLYFVVNRYLHRNEVWYNNKIYELRNDEFGVMLFNEGAGDFSISRAFEKNNVIYIQLYKFQGRKIFWVKLKDKILIDVNISNVKLSNMNEIKTTDLIQ